LSTVRREPALGCAHFGTKLTKSNGAATVCFSDFLQHKHFRTSLTEQEQAEWVR
jgi:hypothetical protein